MSVASSEIFSLMLSRLRLSTALCDSRLRLRFSLAIAALPQRVHQLTAASQTQDTHCFAAVSPTVVVLAAVESAFPPGKPPIPIPSSFGLPLMPIGGRPPPNAAKPPCTLSGVGRLNSPIAPMPMFVCSEPERPEPRPWCIEFTPGSDVPSPLPGWNQPEPCIPSGDRALPCPDADDGGMISGCVMCPRCSGGGETLEIEPRFVRVRRVGPPFVLGGGCGCADACIDDRLRDRERPCEDDGGSFADGEGVCRRKSFGFVAFVVVVFEEKLDRAESEDMCELKELTLDGSALLPLLLPFAPLLVEDDEVFSAKGCDCAFCECPCDDGGGS